MTKIKSTPSDHQSLPEQKSSLEFNLDPIDTPYDDVEGDIEPVEDVEGEEAVAETMHQGTEDTVQFYLNSIASKKILNPEDERRYATAAKAGDEKARSKLIEGNLRLVISIAKRYINRGVLFADLIEEGNLGMIHAIDKFDPERGLRFSTYATWWIRQSIARAVMNQGRTVRLPVHVLRDLYHVLDAKKLIEKEQDDGRPAKVDTLAHLLNRSVEEVNDILLVGDSIVSLDKTVEDGSHNSLVDFLADEDHLPDSALAEKEEAQIIRNWLKKLYETSPKHYEIVVARFGLNGSETKTFDELAIELGVTRERVRQMMNDALGKLKVVVRNLKC